MTFPLHADQMRRTVLPTAACLHAVRDTLIPFRRLALDQAVQEARGHPNRSEAFFEAAWESSSCLELAANTIAPWLDSQLNPDTGPWAEMITYDSGRAERFYNQVANWPPDSVPIVSAHALTERDTLLGLLVEMGLEDDETFEAMLIAETETAKRITSVTRELANIWRQLRRFANAYEHGLVTVPAELGVFTDEEGTTLPDGFGTWLTNPRSKKITRLSAKDAQDGTELAEHSGSLALDLVDHFVQARLTPYQWVNFDAIDGEPSFKPRVAAPFPYWVAKGALTHRQRDLLDQLNIGVEPNPTAVATDRNTSKLPSRQSKESRVASMMRSTSR